MKARRRARSLGCHTPHPGPLPVRGEGEGRGARSPLFSPELARVSLSPQRGEGWGEGCDAATRPPRALLVPVTVFSDPFFFLLAALSARRPMFCSNPSLAFLVPDGVP